MNLNENTLNKPSSEKLTFINSFAFKDSFLNQLFTSIGEISLQYSNSVHLFSFRGFGLYHSNLSMVSILNKFKQFYPLKSQFKFLKLEELVEDQNGTEIIKYALYKHQSEIVKNNPDLLLKTELQKNVENSKKTGKISFHFAISIISLNDS